MNPRSALFVWNHTPAVDSTLEQRDLCVMHNSAQRPTRKNVIPLVLKHYYRKGALNQISYIFIWILLTDNWAYFTLFNLYVFYCLMQTDTSHLVSSRLVFQTLELSVIKSQNQLSWFPSLCILSDCHKNVDLTRFHVLRHWFVMLWNFPFVSCLWYILPYMSKNLSIVHNEVELHFI